MRGPRANVMVLRLQSESDQVLGRVHMHFLRSKRVGITPGHFEQTYRRIYAYIVLFFFNRQKLLVIPYYILSLSAGGGWGPWGRRE